MTDKELLEHLGVIYKALQILTNAVKVLLDESIENKEEIFPEAEA